MDTAAALIVDAMMRLSDAACCISTASSTQSSYLRANKAYCDLVGRGWDDLNNRSLTEDGGAVDGQARDQRLARLNAEGSYVLQPAHVRHSSGMLVPVLLSATRRFLGGESVDIEMIVRLTDTDAALSALHSHHAAANLQTMTIPGSSPESTSAARRHSWHCAREP